jgi:hypothetical protein
MHFALCFVVVIVLYGRMLSQRRNEPHIPRDLALYWDQLYLFPLPDTRDTPQSASLSSPERQLRFAANTTASSDELTVHKIDEELYVSASDSEHHEDDPSVTSPLPHESVRCTSSDALSGSTESNDMFVRELWEGMLSTQQ